MATAPTESSTSRPAPVLNATANAISVIALETSIKRTTRSVAEDTPARSAYYASLNGNRSNYGLQTPIPQVDHDAANGIGGFASFIFNPDSKNQYRVVGSLASGLLPDPHRSELRQFNRTTAIYPSYGLRDGERRARWLRDLLMGSHLRPKHAAHRFSLLSLQRRRL